MLINYYYDSNRNDTLEISQVWMNNKWNNNLKIVNTFDENGNRIKTLTQIWNDNNWVNSSKDSTKYFENGLKKYILLQSWDGKNWENYWQLTFNYNEKWQLDSILVKTWNGNSWRNYYLTTITYSSGNSQMVGLIQERVNNHWENNSRYTYLYNSQNYFIQGIYEYWINDQWLAGDGVIHISNPDGFEEHIFANYVYVYYDQVTDVSVNKKTNLNAYSLSQNYPNPFNPSTKIDYSIKEEGQVTLKVYDILGREIATLVNENKPAGNYTVEFNAANLPSGVYIYKLTAGKFTAVKKLILLH